jgi:hypothetical protein
VSEFTLGSGKADEAAGRWPICSFHEPAAHIARTTLERRLKQAALKGRTWLAFGCLRERG